MKQANFSAAAISEGPVSHNCPLVVIRALAKLEASVGRLPSSLKSAFR